MEIPIYLFTGFLDSGKTKFIQETLEDPRFYEKETTLVLMCEEGEEEYKPERFPSEKVVFHTIYDKTELDESLFNTLYKKYSYDRVIIEYNGMWKVQELYNSIPQNHIIYQEICFFNSKTVLTYNNNMRDLLADKLFNSQMVIFNRVNDGEDITSYHKLVRNISRSAEISYEFENGEIQYDEIEDPLPFDINSDIIEIKDSDYALWYRDISEDQEKYNNKTVRFKSMVIKNEQLEKNYLAIGRFIMVCCEDDISFGGLMAYTDQSDAFENKDWVWVTALIKIEQNKIYGCEGPVLYINDIQFTLPPDEQLATFN